VLRGIDPRLLAALSDNPDLLRALMQARLLWLGCMVPSS
jgi:hypothetical protein